MSVEEQINGFRVLRGALPTDEQSDLVACVRRVIKAAPLLRPVTAWGKPMSVRMTSAGSCGWVIDRGRYRYTARHPETHATWPPIPAQIASLWSRFAGWPAPPTSCLINWYADGARMGLHQDRDEAAFDAPVLSVSLGDRALFRMGGTQRSDSTRSTWLDSGDIVVMGGAARLAFHGIDRIDLGSSTLLKQSGRINLTLRVVADQAVSS